jgi:hypothetical protein
MAAKAKLDPTLKKSVVLRLADGTRTAAEIAAEAGLTQPRQWRTSPS